MFVEVNNQTVVTFPYDYDTLIKHNPSTRFSAEDLLTLYQGTESNLAGNQLVRVVVADKPGHDQSTQTVVQNNEPSLVDGAWVLGWSVQTLGQAEQDERRAQQSASIRAERNRKLSESDWTQLADAQVDKDAWAVYRQALRDVPSQDGFPDTIMWPDKP